MEAYWAITGTPIIITIIIRNYMMRMGITTKRWFSRIMITMSSLLRLLLAVRDMDNVGIYVSHVRCCVSYSCKKFNRWRTTAAVTKQQ